MTFSESKQIYVNICKETVILVINFLWYNILVTDTQNMQSSDEEMEGTENRSKSQKGRLANWCLITLTIIIGKRKIGNGNKW